MEKLKKFTDISYIIKIPIIDEGCFNDIINEGKKIDPKEDKILNFDLNDNYIQENDNIDNPIKFQDDSVPFDQEKIAYIKILKEFLLDIFNKYKKNIIQILKESFQYKASKNGIQIIKISNINNNNKFKDQIFINNINDDNEKIDIKELDEDDEDNTNQIEPNNQIFELINNNNMGRREQFFETIQEEDNESNDSLSLQKSNKNMNKFESKGFGINFNLSNNLNFDNYETNQIKFKEYGKKNSGTPEKKEKNIDIIYNSINNEKEKKQQKDTFKKFGLNINFPDFNDNDIINTSEKPEKKEKVKNNIIEIQIQNLNYISNNQKNNNNIIKNNNKINLKVNPIIKKSSKNNKNDKLSINGFYKYKRIDENTILFLNNKNGNKRKVKRFSIPIESYYYILQLSFNKRIEPKLKYSFFISNLLKKIEKYKNLNIKDGDKINHNLKNCENFEQKLKELKSLYIESIAKTKNINKEKGKNGIINYNNIKQMQDAVEETGIQIVLSNNQYIDKIKKYINNNKRLSENDIVEMSNNKSHINIVIRNESKIDNLHRLCNNLFFFFIVFIFPIFLFFIYFINNSI